MKAKLKITDQRYRKWIPLLSLFTLACLLQSQAWAFRLTVVDGSNRNITGGFRWLIEEDNTDWTSPGVPANDTISMTIHKSHAAVVTNGATTGNQINIPVATARRYYISVMADGYQLGGAQVSPGQAEVRVTLNRHPVPTAQISILAFHDNNPINNAPDATEAGLGGFQVMLADAGGGPIRHDAFGNPLGSTYKFDANTGNPVVDPISGAYVVETLGTGDIYTDANGKALVKYLPPGKFGVQVVPPTGTDWSAGHARVDNKWNQTATIEGTLTVDAWVKANEPRIFIEGFGAGFYHVFFGFVDPAKLEWATNPPPANGITLIGTNRFNHFGRPPNNQMFAVGPPVPQAWVGLNAMGVGAVVGQGLYAAQCNDDGTFVIPNVPPGTYQLVTWDKPLDALFGFNTITVTNGAPGNVIDLGNVLSYRWFGTMQGSIFYDDNNNGFRDANEEGIPNMAVNLRYRDGRVYMGTVSDPTGSYEMAEVFPFFKWLVTEVDFARFKPTGYTTVVDEGGFIPPDNGWAMPSDNVRTPQPQYALNPDGVADVTQPIVNPNTGNNLSRTEMGPVLTLATHLFLNQNNRIDWGKVNYPAGENGGISGIVFYSTTRAETDPREAVGDAWEPGIPRVQVTLYQHNDQPTVADELPATIPNPLPEGITAQVTRLKIKDFNGDGPTLADVDNSPLGWANNPTQKGPEDVDRNGNGVFNPGDAIQIVWTDSFDDNLPTAIQTQPPIVMGKAIVGSDNYSTWNQVSPGVFDGGYAFTSYFPGGVASGSQEVEGLPEGNYVVQASTPPGHLIQTEESMNVGFGDVYQPSKLWMPPELAGDLHLVPQYLTLFPGQQAEAPFAGTWRRLADRKIVQVTHGKNQGCDFHMYTEVPKAARMVGFVLNDLTAEFNAVSPIFGEKGSPGWLPISVRDWLGNEVSRTYSDEYGSYNALLPSTYTVNAPAPSGVVPNMLTIILNDPTMPDPSDPTGRRRIPDPFHNPNFGVTPWTFMFYPGSVSYLDTPIVPIAGFVGAPNKRLDVEPQEGTPEIREVRGTEVGATALAGPYLANADDEIVITAMGTVQVPDPDSLEFGSLATVPRDLGFGESNAVSKATINGVPLDVLSWSNLEIRARLPVNRPAGNAWQLMVTRGNGRTSEIGVTLTYDPTLLANNRVRFVVPRAPSGADPYPDPIQEAIDRANAGDLIIVTSGTYAEQPLMYKPVRLQGSGADTVINATPVPFEKLSIWHAKVADRLGGDPFTANECPGIMVFGRNDTAFNNNPSRIDGFRIIGSVSGGGISVFDRAHNLRISNNHIDGNQGTYGGGIIIGMQALTAILYNNTNITVQYNHITKNGGTTGAGGIAIYNGATGYKILNNTIIGNFCRGNGGGIGHQGVSPGGLIANNRIAFNEVFFGLLVGGDGGGIYINGQQVVAGALSTGAGSISIVNNTIQGNLAGSGNGGGICVTAMNGEDVQTSGNTEDWYALDIVNNIIVNNVAGYAAGGIYLQDATRVRIVNNTIANNDSTATSRSAFAPGETASTPQGAGIVTRTHSPTLAAASGQIFSNPILVNNLIWHNRSFYFDGANQALVPDVSSQDPVYWDLQVVGTTEKMNPQYCVLSDLAGYGSGNNVTGTTLGFVAEYTNIFFTAVAIDELGNNINTRFAPIGYVGNYRITSGALGVNLASSANVLLAYDIEAQARPFGSGSDIGADEYSTQAPIAITLPTVAIVGPPPAGAAPGLNPPIGPGTPPGPMVLPDTLNSMPVDREPLVDSDGDGNPTNDVTYVRLSAGDGFVKMADGNELYMFGFSDFTAMVSNLWAAAAAETDPVLRQQKLNEVDFEVLRAGRLKAEWSAPTIVLKEGQQAYLDLSNVGMFMRPDLFDPHTVHFHGFPQAASIFDGEPMASISVNLGATLRYFYNVVEPGTYIYHCHVEATEHMEMGMLGNLYVLPKQNNLPDGTSLNGFTHHTGYKYVYNDGDGSTRYDVEAALQLGAFDRAFHEQHIAVQGLPFWSLRESYPMINGRGYPDTINPGYITSTTVQEELGLDAPYPSAKIHSLVTAKVGQKILLRISNVSLSDFHTISVLGLPMKVVGKDAKLLRGPTGKNLYYDTTSFTFGGGETVDILIDTTGRVAGTYFLYDARLKHLANDLDDFGGMMTEIRLVP